MEEYEARKRRQEVEEEKEPKIVEVVVVEREAGRRVQW